MNYIKNKVVFIDLDGTLIDTISGATFPKDINDWAMKQDMLDALKHYQPEYIHIVTNQGGIEKGFVNVHEWTDKINKICGKVAAYLGFSATVSYDFCTANDPKHIDRKPNAGMLYRFACAHNDLPYPTAYLMVGDASGKPGDFSDSDKKVAENFGCPYMDFRDFINEYKNEKI